MAQTLETRFCPACGGRLQARKIGDRERAFCPDCKRIDYKQPKVGAGALIEHNQQLLLLQRVDQPFGLRWNLPAGYVEVDESPVSAVVRELREESGLEVEVLRLIDVYSYDDDPRGSGILIVYECRITGGTLGSSPEGVDPTYFAYDHIPTELSGGGHNQAILAWRKGIARDRNAR